MMTSIEGSICLSSLSTSTPDMPSIMMSQTHTLIGLDRASMIASMPSQATQHLVVVFEDDAQGLPRALFIIDDEQDRLADGVRAGRPRRLRSCIQARG